MKTDREKSICKVRMIKSYFRKVKKMNYYQNRSRK